MKKATVFEVMSTEGFWINDTIYWTPYNSLLHTH
jgi:hypothetical protein